MPQIIPLECYNEFTIIKESAVTLKDFTGLGDIKYELLNIIKWSIYHADVLMKYNVFPIRKILLIGPPGCGKTFLVRCMASELNVPILKLDAEETISKYSYGSEDFIKKAFECARKIGYSILLIEDADRFMPWKNHVTNIEKQISIQLLRELDGVNRHSNFITIITTNKPWNMLPSLRKSSRVDKIIYIPSPDDEARRKLFESYLRDIRFEDTSIDQLVELTKPNEDGYYSSYDIEFICYHIKYNLYKMRINLKPVANELPSINTELVNNTLKQIGRSIPHDLVKKYEEFIEPIDF